MKASTCDALQRLVPLCRLRVVDTSFCIALHAHVEGIYVELKIAPDELAAVIGVEVVSLCEALKTIAAHHLEER